MSRLRAAAFMPLLAILTVKDHFIGPDVQWRRWFAWHPVQVRGQRVWLHWVERQINIDDDGPSVVYRWPMR